MFRTNILLVHILIYNLFACGGLELALRLKVTIRRWRWTRLYGSEEASASHRNTGKRPRLCPFPILLMASNRSHGTAWSGGLRTRAASP